MTCPASHCPCIGCKLCSSCTAYTRPAVHLPNMVMSDQCRQLAFDAFVGLLRGQLPPTLPSHAIDTLQLPWRVRRDRDPPVPTLLERL